MAGRLKTTGRHSYCRARPAHRWRSEGRWRLDRRWRQPLAVALGVLTLGSLIGASRGPIYAALGDSYTSGMLLSKPTGLKGCFQSTGSYPELVAAQLQVAQLSDASCAGAVIDDLWKTQKTVTQSNPPQIDALSFETTLVTVGLGANDAQFVQVLSDCLDPQPMAAPCQDKWESGVIPTLESRLSKARAAMSKGLRKIRAKAPIAAVFVVGYPAAVPVQGSSCGSTNLPPGNVAFARDMIAQLNAILAEAAAAASDYFVDEYTPSIGHDVCEPPGVRWEEPGDPTPPDPAWHPNLAGMQAMARVLVQAIDRAQV